MAEHSRLCQFTSISKPETRPGQNSQLNGQIYGMFFIQNQVWDWDKTYHWDCKNKRRNTKNDSESITINIKHNRSTRTVLRWRELIKDFGETSWGVVPERLGQLFNCPVTSKLLFIHPLWCKSIKKNLIKVSVSALPLVALLNRAVLTWYFSVPHFSANK